MIVSHYVELLHQYRLVFLAVSLGTFVAVTAIGATKLILSPTYVATASITVLPTAAELSYTRRFVSDGDGGSDPASVMMQTHIENFFSRPVAELTLKHLNAEKSEGTKAPEDSEEEGLIGTLMSKLSATYDIINTGTDARPSRHDRAIAGIQQAINVDWVQGSYILRISAQAGAPEAAKRLANAVAQAYAERSEEMMGEAAAMVRRHLEDEMRKPQARMDPERLAELRRRLLESELALAGLGRVRVINPATRPLRPNHELVSASIAGGAAGMLLGSLLIIVLDIFSRKVRTSMDMTRLVGSGYLGRVPLRLALAAGQQPAAWRLPHGAEVAFTTTVMARITAQKRGPGPLWIHAVSVGNCDVARSGGIAIAAALASCDLPTDLILDDRDRRHRLERRGDQLHVQRLADEEHTARSALVTAGHMTSNRPPLLSDARDHDSELGEPAAPPAARETPGVAPLPIMVLVVAAGQVYEDVLAAMATEHGRLFLLMP